MYIRELILKAARLGETSLTAPEAAQLAAWRKKMKYHADLPEQFADLNWIFRQLDAQDKYPKEEVWQKILARTRQKG